MTSEVEAKERTIDVALEIIPLINTEMSRLEAVQIVSEKYNVGSRQAENYIYRAYKIIHDQVMEHQDETLGSIIHKYDQLYEKAIEQEDYRECRAILKDLYDLLGFKKNKIEISGDIKDLFSAMDGLNATNNNG